MGKRILIVIPAYNEEERIGLLLDKLSGLFNLSDVLVVDDGSEDETASIANDYGVFLVKQPTNLGKGMALKKGFEFAIEKGYEAVITMDSDLQHNPEEIPKFIRLIEEEGGDILIGTREHDLHNMPFMRFLVNNVTSLVASILAGERVHDSQSGYRLIRSKVLRDIELNTSRFQMETEIIVKAARKGYTIKEVPIETLYFKDIHSHINPVIDTIRFVRLSLRLMWQ